MPQETLSEFMRRQYDGKPASEYLSLGELVKLKYNGHTVNVSDLASRLKNERFIKKMPILEIIKKRAAYQQNLWNRKKKKEEEQVAAANSFKAYTPQVHFPNVKLPKI